MKRPTREGLRYTQYDDVFDQILDYLAHVDARLTRLEQYIHPRTVVIVHDAADEELARIREHFKTGTQAALITEGDTRVEYYTPPHGAWYPLADEEEPPRSVIDWRNGITRVEVIK